MLLSFGFGHFRVGKRWVQKKDWQSIREGERKSKRIFFEKKSESTRVGRKKGKKEENRGWVIHFSFLSCKR